MAKSQALTVNIGVDGARATLRAFAALPKDASDELRTASLDISKALVGRVSAAAVERGGQAALIAPTVKANRDRVPSISAGGTKRVGRHRTPAGQLLMASEFGMDKRSGWYAAAAYSASTGTQYGAHLGRGSYWFFRTVEANDAIVSREWNQAADSILEAWAGR